MPGRALKVDVAAGITQPLSELLAPLRRVVETNDMSTSYVAEGPKATEFNENDPRGLSTECLRGLTTLAQLLGAGTATLGALLPREVVGVEV